MRLFRVVPTVTVRPAPWHVLAGRSTVADGVLSPCGFGAHGEKAKALELWDTSWPPRGDVSCEKCMKAVRTERGQNEA